MSQVSPEEDSTQNEKRRSYLPVREVVLRFSDNRRHAHLDPNACLKSPFNQVPKSNLHPSCVTLLESRKGSAALRPASSAFVQQTCALIPLRVRLHARHRLYGLGCKADTKFMIILLHKCSQSEISERPKAAHVVPTPCQLRHRAPRKTTSSLLWAGPPLASKQPTVYNDN